MSNTNQRRIWSMDTVKEIVNDLFCFDFILEIKRQMKNEEAKAYLGNFLRTLAPVYIHEISNALHRLGIIPKEQLLSPEYQKLINSERQLSLKKIIVSSKEAEKAIADMGINFKERVYDIRIAVNNNELYDLNFELQIAPVNDFDFWNFLFKLPRTMLKAAFSAITPDFNLEEIYTRNSNHLNDIAHRLDDLFSFSSYSYSAFRLFQHANTLEETDKIMILYRYRMIASVGILSQNFPSLHATFGGEQIINIDSFFRKYRALVICIIGDELQRLDTQFANHLKGKINASVGHPDFFRLNRKVRNNLHYETTNVLTESEMNIVHENQQLYLSVIEKAFRSCLHLDIDKECHVMTGFSDAFRKSGLSKEELDKHYYSYYLKYRITGKL